MWLIKPDEEWPEKSFPLVVLNGITECVERGLLATHLLISEDACRYLPKIDLGPKIGIVDFYEKKGPGTYMGLEIRWTLGSGLEILCEEIKS